MEYIMAERDGIVSVIFLSIVYINDKGISLKTLGRVYL